MWTETFHCFIDEATFLAACDVAGWARGPDGKPMPPQGVSLDVLGTLTAPPTMGPNSTPMAGAIIDPGFHVNMARHCQSVPAPFQASVITPATPHRVLSLPVLAPATAPVPGHIPAWKGKAALRETGLLESVEAAVQAAGGRVQDAWEGAATWDRGSEFLGDLAGALGLSAGQVDQVFMEAEAMRG